MKALLLRSTLATITLLAFGSTRATEPVTRTIKANSAGMERELQHQIDRFVSYPLMADPGSMDGDVVVSFVIDTEGKVKVIRAESANSTLEEYVLGRLSKVDIGSNPDGTWKTTHMRFRFRPER